MTPFLSISCITVAIILFLLILKWKVDRDYNLWRAKKAVKHGKSWRLLVLLLTPSVIIMAIPLEYIYLFNMKVWLWGVIVTAPFFAFWWLLLFNGFYSNKRRRNFWDLGSQDNDDADTDDILQALPKWLHITIVILLPAIFTTLYLIALL